MPKPGEYNKPGYVMVARAIVENDIWTKPSDYLKVWLFILLEVKWEEDHPRFDRGSNFFNIRDIARECGVSYHTARNTIRYLKSTGRITTQKTTRGMFIFVVNYNKYQDPEFYKSHTKNRTKSQLKAKQKPHYNLRRGRKIINIDINNTWEEKSYGVEDFEPETYEEGQVVEIARRLEEDDLGYLLGKLNQGHYWAIEKAWGVFREIDKGRIENPPAYFNGLVESLIGEKDDRS